MRNDYTMIKSWNTCIKPSETSNTLSLRANSMNFVNIFRTPRLAMTAALSKAIVSVDIQGLSLVGICGGCRGTN